MCRALSAIRLLMAAIKQREVDERIELADDQVIAAIEKMLKQRRDSISQFESAGRQDLADTEKFEVSVLQGYMPQPLTDAEAEALVVAAIASSGGGWREGHGQSHGDRQAANGRTCRHGQGVRPDQSQAGRLSVSSPKFHPSDCRFRFPYQ